MLLDLLKDEYSEEDITKIQDGLTSRVTTFRINTLHNNSSIDILNKSTKYKRVSWYDDAYIFEGDKKELLDLDLYSNGDIYIQGLSSMLPPLILDPNENEMILDMTASPGSKTSEIAALANNRAIITAVEKNKIRYDRLKYNMDKLGVKKISIIKQDARYLDDNYIFDKILLDVPCSGSGTLTNINDFDVSLFNRISAIQKELVDKAIKMLKVGGILVYSTCSILKKENEDVINYVLSKYSNMELVSIDKSRYKNIELLPSSVKECLKVMPNKYYEGFFVAKFRKK